jgi:hypothetical protein
VQHPLFVSRNVHWSEDPGGRLAHNIEQPSASRWTALVPINLILRRMRF